MTTECGLSGPETRVFSATVALIDSEPARLRLLGQAVSRLGARAVTGSAAAGCQAVVLAGGVDLPDRMAALRAEGLAAPVLAVLAGGSLAAGVAVMKAGASDVVPWPASLSDLEVRLAALLAKAPARPLTGASDGFVGASPAMQRVYDQISRLAPSKAPVFITGESGTGKELTAQSIHRLSGREAGRLVALNCGAIPRELIESELFGHARGAFTGAQDERIGAAELAHGGTLFLDEIGELDLAVQAKLLRFLQTGELRRLGEGKVRHIDARIVCATHRDIAQAVAEGRFREDLYYRLCVLPLHLPPLRERDEDVLVLARHFLARFAREEGRQFRSFAPEAERLIASCPWPGNVRQLQNVIRRLVVMQDGVEVSAAMLPLALAHGSFEARATPVAAAAPTRVEPFWQTEKRIIEEAIAAFDGNMTRAAAALELSPSTLYRKKEQWQRAAG